MDVFFVIVIFDKTLNESSSIKSLSFIASETNDLSFHLLIYDNSKIPQRNFNIIAKPNIDYTYIHNPKNPGIAKAYNKGLELAHEKGYKWLILLDDDSSFDISFWSEIHTLTSQNISEDIVSFVPHICHKNNTISPMIINKLGISKPVSLKNTGIFNRRITALNTCATVKIDFLLSIGGFNEYFNLDMLDHWLFKKITENHKKIYVLTSIVQHRLSYHEKEYIHIERYKNLLKKESAFKQAYETPFFFAIYRLGLIYRALRQFIVLKKKNHAKSTINHFFSTS